MTEKNTPHASASVILLDPARGEGRPFALYLLRRRSASSFMPNRFVFPGGRVEASDGAEPLADDTLRNCALRELWEEAGVILAKGPRQICDIDKQSRDAARREVDSGAHSLSRGLSSLGLEPDYDSLIPYARWITPTARPKRFDTAFFLALMPGGQQAACDEKETSEGLWISPARALEENLAGKVELAPPQVRILGELAGFSSLEELIDWCGRNEIKTVQPFLWLNKGERVILFPWDPDYEQQTPVTKAEPCPAGQASRVVHRDGLWLPHKCE